MYIQASKMVLKVKNPHDSAGDIRDEGSVSVLGRSPGGEDGNPLQYCCLERIPWIEEPGGLQSMGLQRARRDSATKHSTVATMPH